MRNSYFPDKKQSETEQNKDFCNIFLRIDTTILIWASFYRGNGNKKNTVDVFYQLVFIEM